jgi:hypothetical protein
MRSELNNLNNLNDVVCKCVAFIQLTLTETSTAIWYCTLNAVTYAVRAYDIILA